MPYDDSAALAEDDAAPPVQAPANRAERRTRTRAAILAAARETFAENGFQKATIRAVARRAGYDPALVMQHFGSKTELFREAASIDLDVSEVLPGPPATQAERILRRTFEALDDQAAGVASTLRTMLTHDDVADEALRLFHPPDPAAIAGSEADPLADLRRELVTAIILGTAITRYVLKSAAVESASQEDLMTCLLPVVETLRSPRLRPPDPG